MGATILIKFAVPFINLNEVRARVRAVHFAFRPIPPLPLFNVYRDVRDHDFENFHRRVVTVFYNETLSLARALIVFIKR